MKKIEGGVKNIGLLDQSINSDSESEGGVFCEDANGDEDILNVSGVSSLSDASSTSTATTATRTRVIKSGLNDVGRIDYTIQEREIEQSNNYIFAMGAHCVYWNNKDLTLFIAEQISRS